MHHRHRAPLRPTAFYVYVRTSQCASRLASVSRVERGMISHCYFEPLVRQICVTIVLFYVQAWNLAQLFFMVQRRFLEVEPKIQTSLLVMAAIFKMAAILKGFYLKTRLQNAIRSHLWWHSLPLLMPNEVKIQSLIY